MPIGQRQVGVVDGGHRQADPGGGKALLQLPAEGGFAGPHRPIEADHGPLARRQPPTAVGQQLGLEGHEPSLKPSSTTA
jgi:hypothetical protein